MVKEITDTNLADFCKWFAEWHGRKSVEASVITTCMTGYFSTYSKAADKLLARCKALKLVAVKDGIATIIV